MVPDNTIDIPSIGIICTRQPSVNSKPPKASFEAGERFWKYNRNPTTGARQKVILPTFQDQLKELLSCIREGASKAAGPGKDGTYMVHDFSGNWVHVCQAIFDARKSGRGVPRLWEASLRSSYRDLKKTSRPPSVTRLATMAVEWAGKTTSLELYTL